MADVQRRKSENIHRRAREKVRQAKRLLEGAGQEEEDGEEEEEEEEMEMGMEVKAIKAPLPAKMRVGSPSHHLFAGWGSQASVA